MGGLYILAGSSLEICGKFWIRPDWGNTVRADMAGLGSIGLKQIACKAALIKHLFSATLNHYIIQLL